MSYELDDTASGILKQNGASRFHLNSEPRQNAMRRFHAVILHALVIFISAGFGYAQESTIVVSGKANIFGSGKTSPPGPGGGGGGILPPYIGVDDSQVITFPSVTGSVTYAGNRPSNGPDGAINRTDITSWAGISGMYHGGRIMFLTGIFLDDNVPSDPSPARLNVTSYNGAEEIRPELDQTFFVGDGKTSRGVTQRFYPPSGAKRLFLGFADASAFIGPPGFYDDNGGSVSATVLQTAIKLEEILGLRKSTVGHFAQETDPHSDGRLFLDTVDGGQILRKPDRQSVKITVDITGITDPSDYVVRWEARDPDDLATHPDLDASNLGGDNTGTPHEADQFWFSEADHLITGEQNRVAADETTVIGEAETFISVEDDAFQSTVRFNYSDDGGDNFRIRAVLVDVSNQESIDIAEDSSGVLTVWRLRYIQTYAMEKPNDDIQRHPVGSTPGMFQVSIEPGPNGQSDTMILGGDDGRDDTELYVHSGGNGIVETTANSGGNSFDADAKALVFRQHYANALPDHLPYIDFKVFEGQYDLPYWWFLPHGRIPDYMHGHSNFMHQASLMSLAGVNTCRYRGGDVGGAASFPPHCVISAGLIRKILPEFLDQANVHEIGHLLLGSFEAADPFHLMHSDGQDCGFSQAVTLPPQICSRHASLLRDRVPRKFAGESHSYDDVINDSEKTR